MADEPGLIEAAHRVRPVAAGHHRDVGDMRRAAHGAHGRLDIARLELGCGMGVEHLAEGFALPRHRFFSRFTFASITSQIIAAMSGPPNCATWRMPVGEVTLISVRYGPITSMPVNSSPRRFSSGPRRAQISSSRFVSFVAFAVPPTCRLERVSPEAGTRLMAPAT